MTFTVKAILKSPTEDLTEPLSNPEGSRGVVLQGEGGHRRTASNNQEGVSLKTKLACSCGMLICLTLICSTLLIHHLLKGGEEELEHKPSQWVVVLGGSLEEDQPTDSVEVLDLFGQCAGMSPPKIPPLPKPMSGHVGAYFSDEAGILVCGGLSLEVQCYIFRNGAEHWTQVRGDGLVEPRVFGSLGAVEGKVILLGGSRSSLDGTDSGRSSSEIHEWSREKQEMKWSPGPSLPGPQTHHCVVSLGDILYSTGGYQQGRAIYSLGTSSEKWTNCSVSLYARYKHGCTSLGPHKLLLSGGLSPTTGACAHTEVVSVDTDGRTADSALAVGHFDCRTEPVLLSDTEGQAFMVGGQQSDGSLPTEILQFNSQTLSWNSWDRVSLKQGRSDLVAIKIPCNFKVRKQETPKFQKLLDMP